MSSPAAPIPSRQDAPDPSPRPTAPSGPATLQNATKDYTPGAVSGVKTDSSARASGGGTKGNDAGLQNATNLACAPAAPPQPQPGALDSRQRDAIELILQGRSDRAVAEAVKVHRVTVTKWRLYDPGFQAVLNRRREERWTSAEERVRALLHRAVRVLDRQLRCDDPHVSYRAARALVQMAGSRRFAPGPHPTDPLAVLELFAREKHGDRTSRDPRTDALTDGERFGALRDLRDKQERLARLESGAVGGVVGLCFFSLSPMGLGYPTGSG